MPGTVRRARPACSSWAQKSVDGPKSAASPLPLPMVFLLPWEAVFVRRGSESLCRVTLGRFCHGRCRCPIPSTNDVLSDARFLSASSSGVWTDGAWIPGVQFAFFFPISIFILFFSLWRLLVELWWCLVGWDLKCLFSHLPTKNRQAIPNRGTVGQAEVVAAKEGRDPSSFLRLRRAISVVAAQTRSWR